MSNVPGPSSTASPSQRAPLLPASPDRLFPFLLLLLLCLVRPAAAQDFEPIHRVFSHPRCTNCHADTAGPLQREGRPHVPAVQRGPDGAGVGALACRTCHRDSNTAIAPGSADWRMPKPDLPMVFRNRTPDALCRQILDLAQNGGLDADGLGAHMIEDPRIAWAWSPGAGRSSPPISQAALLDALAAWLKAGAACPD